ncbi:MAG: hypothetical protein JWM10_3592, partial [Myxococcaceae bacterium]|nr:hypothetical protein [Myxococcaceae bacterium]
MKTLTRRELLLVTGAAALAGCGETEPGLPPDDGAGEDAAPDQTFDASDQKFPEDADAPAEDAPSLDASLDASPLDASLDAPPRDVPRDTPADVRRDAPAAADVRRDA